LPYLQLLFESTLWNFSHLASYFKIMLHEKNIANNPVRIARRDHYGANANQEATSQSRGTKIQTACYQKRRSSAASARGSSQSGCTQIQTTRY
jgi:hypothetical protein